MKIRSNSEFDASTNGGPAAERARRRRREADAEDAQVPELLDGHEGRRNAQDLAAVRDSMIRGRLLFWTPHFRETSEGSFLALSTPICATKYSFCSSFQDLQD